MENCGEPNKPFSALFSIWEPPVTDPSTTSPPSWIRGWLLAAGFYNLAWGAANIIWPNALFDFAGAKRVNYPEIWQCVGMIVGVYGSVNSANNMRGLGFMVWEPLNTKQTY